MAVPPSVEQLYECAQTLSTVSKPDLDKHEKDYRTILLGVKGTAQAKRLASQFIARFFSQFPKLANQALDAIIDLCEDDDVNIRKQAIKDMPSLCKHRKEFLPKTADILTQLLQTEDSSESVVVQNSLMTLFRNDAQGTLIGLFSQIKNGGDEVKEKAIHFLHVKIKTSGAELLTKEDEAVLLDQISKAADDCSPDEFQLFMAILACTRLPNTVTGQNCIVELIKKTADLDAEFSAHSENQVFKLIHCTQAAVPFFSTQVKSTAFCHYICMKILPCFDDISSDDAKAQVLKVLAEICQFTGDVADSLTAATNIHHMLWEHLPTPPDVKEDCATSSTFSETKLEFTKVECLLFAFHTIARQCPSYVTEKQQLFKQLKTRLQYFALGIQGYIRKLNQVLSSKQEAELETEENRVKAMALRSANNINALIKDLFLNPPAFKTKILLSWVTRTGPGAKRPSTTPIAADKPSLTKKKFTLSKRGDGPAVYAPPQGKYSAGPGFNKFGGQSAARGTSRYSRPARNPF